MNKNPLSWAAQIRDLPHGLSPWVQHRFRSRRLGFVRENYLYCLEIAARESIALGHSRLAVIEFGVAGGNGLIELERISVYLEGRLPISFEIYGFDGGTGLPPPQDYRDTPFKWQAGDYLMDQRHLERRLRRSHLIIGDVRETVGQFFARHNPAPLGAVMFDLDYYSSTSYALRIFDAESGSFLPRVQCYFDDVGTIPSLGVPLAIHEFNADRHTSRLEQNGRTVHATHPYVRGWKIYEYHDFVHPEYGRPLSGPRQLPLLDRSRSR